MDGYENIWSKVTCPERLYVRRASGAERRGAIHTTTWCRSRGKVIEEFPDRVLWGTYWRIPIPKGHMPDDGKLVDYVPQIAIRRTCSEFWSTIRCGSTGPKNKKWWLDKRFQLCSRHHRASTRAAIAQRLLAEPVLHVADEGREPARFKANRARLCR